MSKLILITILIFNTISLKQEMLNINELATRYNEDRLRLYPLVATYEGDYRYNDILPNDITVSYINKLKSFYSQYLTDLQKIDMGRLLEEEQISYDLLRWECEINLEKLKYPLYLMPINQLTSKHIIISQLAGGDGAQPFNTVKDYHNWLNRLNGFIEWCDTAISNMKKGMQLGYVIPKSLVVKVIPQFKELEKGPVEEHLFYKPIKSLPENITSVERELITNAYKNFIGNKIIPAFRKMREFIEFEYFNNCKVNSGISDMSWGKKHYDFLIRFYTTSDLSADEIFNIGVNEVNRILAEMEKVKSQVNFKGSLKEFFSYVRDKKELKPFTQPEQVIENFEQIYDVIKPNIKKLFNKIPKTAFEIRRTEAFREATASAEYWQGSIDGTRPGIFYVPIPDATKYNTFTDEDLFLHEAIPGHHFQVSLQQENINLPQFRKTIWYNAYGEGWSLYCESLGKELGLYNDPYQYFGYLVSEIHRAIRLVVDVGIHVKGWTREEAIQYSLERESLQESIIISEIERYMADPGQSLSYKIGQLKILELRNKSKNILGDEFDIRIFHDKVLESGCLPLAVLEYKISKWLN